MKRFNIYINGAAVLGLTLGLALTSCNDMLDTTPQGVFTVEQMDATAIEGLISSSYNGLEAHFFGNNESFAGPSTNWIFDVRSDDALKGGGATSMEQNIHQLEISNITSDNVSSLYKWENNYYAISRCNKAILAIKNADEEKVTNKDELYGELRFLRAYYYFDLIRVFKRIPYFTEETESPSSVSNTQYTRAEIYDKIVDDLKFAWNNLPSNSLADGRVNKYTAAALLAKVYAQNTESGSCNWDQVRAWANEVINNSDNKYSFYPKCQDQYKIDNNNKYESILAIQCSTANNNAHINWSNLLNVTYSEGSLYGTGDDFFYGSQNLVNAFATDENGLPFIDKENPDGDVTSGYFGTVDPRLDFTVGRIGFPFRGHDYTKGWCRAYDIYGEYSNKKCCCDPADTRMTSGWPWGGSPLNWCLLRYSDIYLLCAEADVELGDLEDARNKVNDIRKRANKSIDLKYVPQDLNSDISYYNIGEYPEQGWTQDYARKAVRMERRLELALEGQRWFDLQRWGTTVQTMNKYFTAEKKFHTYYQDAHMTDNDLFLKIYYSEVDNSNGLYTQY